MNIISQLYMFGEVENEYLGEQKSKVYNLLYNQNNFHYSSFHVDPNILSLLNQQ